MHAFNKTSGKATCFLAEVELIFFIIAGTVLYFGFRMRIMFVTHWCFHCSWAGVTQSHVLFSLSSCLTAGDAGRAQEAGRGQHSWLQQTQGMFQTIWNYGQQINQEENCLGGHCLGTDSTSVCWWWIMLSTCNPCCSWVLYFFMIIFIVIIIIIISIINLLNLNPLVFSLYPSDSIPCPMGEEWARGNVGLINVL